MIERLWGETRVAGRRLRYCAAWTRGNGTGEARWSLDQAIIPITDARNGALVGIWWVSALLEPERLSSKSLKSWWARLGLNQ